MAELVGYTLGDGPKLTVLLHGLLGTGRNLRTLATSWASRDPSRRFFVPDLPGHGQSPGWLPQRAGDRSAPPPPEAPPSASCELAAAVWATLDARAFGGPAHLVGHSLGARVALAAAQLDASRVERITMLDMTPGPMVSAPGTSPTRAVLDTLVRAPDATHDRQEMRQFLLRQGQPPAVVDWLLMNVVLRDGKYVWRIDREAIATLHDRVLAEDLWPIAEARLAPICCIRGEHSSYVTDADAARLRQLGHLVHTLPGAGHDVHVDALPALLELLTA